MRILIVEDNIKLAEYMQEMFERESYAVDCVHDGVTGLRRASSDNYDLVVLDIMLPQKDGISVCTELREAGSTVPIIMLTAKGGVEDRIQGLDSGADDYLIKPFEMAELLARVRALLRRPQVKLSEKLTAQDISIDSATHSVMHKDKTLVLTLKEYAVLEYLVRNKGMTVTREQILEHCWDFAYDSFSNIVDVYIKRLRKKLDDNDERYIATARGVGYTLHA